MKDARLDELRFLTRLEREGSIIVSNVGRSDAAIAIRLISEGLLFDASTFRYPRPELDLATAEDYQRRLAWEQARAINSIQYGQEVCVRSTHAAAVRRAELEQSIVRDRLRDPTGILFDGRYADRDLSIQVFSASTVEPLAVAYLDLNGLKQLNDRHGHAAGDEAIRVYFEVISDVIAQVGAAYRMGGDEVMILVSNTTLTDAAKLLRAILRGLGSHRVHGEGLSAVAGLTRVVDPSESPADVKARADKIQYRAKERSKSRPPSRFGALAVDGQELVEEFEVTAHVHFTETERLALREMFQAVKVMFTYVIWSLCLPDGAVWLPMTRDEHQGLFSRWQAAVAEKRWERIYVDKITTDSGGNVAAGRMIEHMIRMSRGIVGTASSVLGRYGSSGGNAIRVIASFEQAAKNVANVLTAEGSGNPAPRERLVDVLEQFFPATVEVLDQCWRAEHQGERGVLVDVETATSGAEAKG